MVAVVSVVNAVMPAISRAGTALVTSADVADNRLSSRVEIIHATGEDTATETETWVKNTGSSLISPLDRIDVFFGSETDFRRYTYGGAGCSAPCWDYELENDTEWWPTATLHITIYLDAGDALAAGNTYYVKVVAPNGVEDTKFFTL